MQSDKEISQDRSNEDKKKRRRTRKDTNGRTFVCPCGKSYLSYPALYTHVKTKHQGRYPKPNDQSQVMADTEDKKEEFPLEIIKETIEKLALNENQKETPRKLTKQQIRETDQIINIWNEWQQNKSNDPSDSVLQASIECILGHFLGLMKTQIREEAFVYLSEFVLSLKQGLMAENSQDYCKQNNGEQLPYTFNDLVIHNRLTTSLVFDNDNNSENEQMKFICKMIFLLGSWMFKQRYTNLRVEYNEKNK